MVINLGLQHLMDDMDDSDDTLSEGEESIMNGIVGYLVIIIIVVILKEIHLQLLENRDDETSTLSLS